MTSTEERLRALRLSRTTLSSQPDASGLHYRTGITNEGGEILIFLELDNSVGLFVPFGNKDGTSLTPDVRSSYITLKRIHRDGKPFAQLQLRNEALESVFEVFVDSFLEEVSSDPESAVKIVSSQLKDWRALFAGGSSTALSPSEELGLIGELETMYSLTEIYGEQAFHRWTGPSAQHHDFRFDDRSIECKATRIVNGLHATINGSDQLQPEPDIPLYLSVRKYEETPTGDITLKSLVGKLLDDPQIPRELFLKRLAELGYHHVNDDDFQGLNYRFIESAVFEVGENFPRIKRDDLNPRIGQVVYAIDLTPPDQIPGYQQNGFSFR